jgi:hypothetical protein
VRLKELLLMVADKLKIVHYALKTNDSLCDIVVPSITILISLFEKCYNLEVQQLLTSIFYYLLPKIDSPDMKIYLPNRNIWNLVANNSAMNALDPESNEIGFDLGFVSVSSSSDSLQPKIDICKVVSLVDYFFDIPGFIQIYYTLGTKKKDEVKESSKVVETSGEKLDEIKLSPRPIAEQNEVEPSSSSVELDVLLATTTLPTDSDYNLELEIDQPIEGVNAKNATQSQGDGDIEKEKLETIEQDIRNCSTHLDLKLDSLAAIDEKTELNEGATTINKKPLNLQSESQWCKLGDTALLLSRDIVNLLRFLNSNSDRWKNAIETRIERSLESNLETETSESKELNFSVQAISTLYLLSADCTSSPPFLVLAADLYHVGIVKELTPAAKEAVLMFEDNEVKYGYSLISDCLFIYFIGKRVLFRSIALSHCTILTSTIGANDVCDSLCSFFGIILPMHPLIICRTVG